jgi:hypothetical protein
MLLLRATKKIDAVEIGRVGGFSKIYLDNEPEVRHVPRCCIQGADSGSFLPADFLSFQHHGRNSSA